MSKLQEIKATVITNEYTARGMKVVDTTADGGRAKHLKITGIDNTKPELGDITLNVCIKYHSLDITWFISQGNWECLYSEKF